MSWPPRRVEQDHDQIVDDLYEERFGLPAGYGDDLKRNDRCWADSQRDPLGGCTSRSDNTLGLCNYHRLMIIRSRP